MVSGGELISFSIIKEFFSKVDKNHQSLNRIAVQENADKGRILFFYDRFKGSIYPEYKRLESHGMTPIRTHEEVTEMMKRVETSVRNYSHRELKKIHGIDKAKGEVIIRAVMDLFQDFVNERPESDHDTVQEEGGDENEEDDDEADVDRALEDTLAADSHNQAHKPLSSRKVNDLFANRGLKNHRTPSKVNSQTSQFRGPATDTLNPTRRPPALPKESAITNALNKLESIREKDPKVSDTLLNPAPASEKQRDKEVYQIVICRVTETGEPNITTHRVSAGMYTLDLPNNAYDIANISLNDSTIADDEA